jgi:hypothetical protein
MIRIIAAISLMTLLPAAHAQTAPERHCQLEAQGDRDRRDGVVRPTRHIPPCKAAAASARHPVVRSGSGGLY